MATLGNLLWFILGGGFAASILWFLFGILMALTIVGIPFAKAAFRIAEFAAFPFGKDLVDVRDLGEKRLLGTGLVNLIWIVLAGIWLTLFHILAGIGYCVTIVGIPFGLAHFKLATVSFAPLGKKPVYR